MDNLLCPARMGKSVHGHQEAIRGLKGPTPKNEQDLKSPVMQEST